MRSAIVLGSLVLAAGSALAREPAAPHAAYVAGVATPQEGQALQALLDEVGQVLRSSRFAQNMAVLAPLYPAIFLRVDGAGAGAAPVFGTAAELLQIVQARAPWRPVATQVALVGGDQYAFALAGVTGDGVHASFALGRRNFARWLSPDPVERSCAVNTVAHELSHLISSHPTAFRLETQPIRDFDAARRSGQSAVASYLVGTVAQCTWLQGRGHTPAVELRDCVQVFGHRGFNALRCDQFAQGQQVRWRDGLPAEHLIND